MTDDATAEIAALHIGPIRTNPQIAIAAAAIRADVVAAIRDFMSYRFTSAPYRIFPVIDDARQWIATLSR